MGENSFRFDDLVLHYTFYVLSHIMYTARRKFYLNRLGMSNTPPLLAHEATLPNEFADLKI